MEDLHKPVKCSKCEGQLKYIGIGNYECKSCNNIERDDYGKVRHYIENHRETNVAAVAHATGVHRKDIQRMLDDKKFSVVKDKYVDAE